MAGANCRRQPGGMGSRTHFALPFKACRNTSLMARSMLVLSFAEVAYLAKHRNTKKQQPAGEGGAGKGARGGGGARLGF